MKSLLCRAAFASFLLASAFVVSAQVKAPSQYFRKDSPNRPGQNTPVAPSAPRSPAPASAKFKDVAVNAEFYFLTDTNRAHPWTKISASTAKNAKNGATAPIKAETPVQR